LMPTEDQVNEFVPRGPKRELMRLIGQVQALNGELDALRQRGAGDRELRAKERALEQLRWRLAEVARHAATDVSRPAA
jgi:hypothetical protein